MSRIRTTGISETTLKCDGKIMRVIDVGGTRSERKKWIPAFQNVDAIIFHVDIGAYDQGLLEDITVNRMEEDLTLFESIVNSRWFIKTCFILHFTKMDKLENKIPKSDLKDYFPDFEGRQNSVEDAKAYIESRFLGLNRHETKHIEVVYTSFIDGFSVDARRIFDTLNSTLDLRPPAALWI